MWYAARRLLAVVVVVLVTPALTFVVLGSLRNDVSRWTQLQELPGYRSATFLDRNLGKRGPFGTPLRDVVLDGLPVDIALLIGGMSAVWRSAS